MGPCSTLIIRSGTVVDGTGAPGRRADVGISDGRIAAIGDLDDQATRTIDADGKVVAPGFVDIHTHYDAQVFWDRRCQPVAAARRHDRHRRELRIHDRAARARARRLPHAHAGARRRHADRRAARRRAVELAHVRRVPRSHRRHAGTERGLPRRPLDDPSRRRWASARRRATATADDLDAMRALLDASLAAGGLGFSSSWARTHNDAAGDMVPSRYAIGGRDHRAVPGRARTPGNDARIHSRASGCSRTTPPTS